MVEVDISGPWRWLMPSYLAQVTKQYQLMQSLAKKLNVCNGRSSVIKEEYQPSLKRHECCLYGGLGMKRNGYSSAIVIHHILCPVMMLPNKGCSRLQWRSLIIPTRNAKTGPVPSFQLLGSIQFLPFFYELTAQFLNLSTIMRPHFVHSFLF